MRGAQAVLHLAGLVGVWRPMEDYHAINVTGTQNVCRVALSEGVDRVVHVSSWVVYGMALGQPVREDFLLRPFHEPYAVTKAAGDIAVQRMIAEDRLHAVIVRPGTFFGPGDHLHFGRIADRLRAGTGVIVGPGDNVLPFVYVTDVVQGLLLALGRKNAVGQAFNITNDSPLTQEQFLQAIADEIGSPAARVHIPYHALYTVGYLAEHLAMVTGTQRQPVVTRVGVKFFGTDNRHSIDKARRELGYKPRVALREGVRLAATWYRTHSQPDASSTPDPLPVRSRV
jgi:nucleoside-diphosphate-sugar epimerase